MSDSAPGGSSDRYPTPQTSETSANSQSLDNQWEEVEQELARPLQPVDRSPEATVSKSDYASSTVRSFDGSSPLVMVETAFLASAASLIWLVNFYFPIGPFLRIFFPIPIALIYLRWGARAAWMGALVWGDGRAAGNALAAAGELGGGDRVRQHFSDFWFFLPSLVGVVVVGG